MSSKKVSVAAGGSFQPGLDDQEFAVFMERMQARFVENLLFGGGVLFTIQEPDVSLWDSYLDLLPDHRQYHTCHCCRRFISTYGGLVTIGDDGRLTSAVWCVEDAPDFYRDAVATLARKSVRGKVEGVFISSAPVYGQPVTGEWTHFAVKPTTIYRDKLKTAWQAAAEKLEDYRNIQRALAEFSLPMLNEAMRVLESDALYRSEKVIGPARWLRDLHVAREGVHGSHRDNITWKAIALAPAGFCHPRSSMVGTLLEDIAAGMDFDSVSSRFAKKMHPLQYQRPQAAPTAGNIAEAEKIVEKLGIAPSLERRFARLDEVTAIWKPREAQESKPATGGVFSHLQPKNAAPPIGGMELPATKMTWQKFSTTVLPNVSALKFYNGRSNNYTALLTAVHADAPPIHQWDFENDRNPVSWYVYHGGSSPDQWRLSNNSYCDVTAVTLNPAHWGNAPMDHQGEGFVLLLQGALDTRENSGNALFPETLKSELRAVRSVIERYSRTAKISGREEASACGVGFSKGSSWDCRIRACINGSWQEYTLDRWD